MQDLRHAPLYSIPECARHLGLSVATVRGWIGKPGSDRKGDGKPLVIPAGSDPTALSFTNLVEVFVLSSLNRNRQRPTRELLESFLSKRLHGALPSSACSTKSEFIIDRISYDDNGVPIKFYPFTRGYGREDPKLVVIDPAVSFGSPVVAGSGVRTLVVARRIKGGEPFADIADDYLLDQSQIEEAVRYELAV